MGGGATDLSSNDEEARTSSFTGDATVAAGTADSDGAIRGTPPSLPLEVLCVSWPRTRASERGVHSLQQHSLLRRSCAQTHLAQRSFRRGRSDCVLNRLTVL